MNYSLFFYLFIKKKIRVFVINKTSKTKKNSPFFRKILQKMPKSLLLFHKKINLYDKKYHFY
jgi:hypothetical protein